MKLPITAQLNMFDYNPAAGLYRQLTALAFIEVHDCLNVQTFGPDFRDEMLATQPPWVNPR